MKALLTELRRIADALEKIANRSSSYEPITSASRGRTDAVLRAAADRARVTGR